MTLNNDITDNFLDDELQFHEWVCDILEREKIDNTLVFVDPVLLDKYPDTLTPYTLTPIEFYDGNH